MVRVSVHSFLRRGGFWCGLWVSGEGRSDALAGLAGLQDIDWNRRQASIGYWLGERFEGRGLVSAAVRALLGHGFADLGLERIEIACARENRRSRAVPERLGFRTEGVRPGAERLGDRLVDHVVYALRRKDWLVPSLFLGAGVPTAAR